MKPTLKTELKATQWLEKVILLNWIVLLNRVIREDLTQIMTFERKIWNEGDEGEVHILKIRSQDDLLTWIGYGKGIKGDYKLFSQATGKIELSFIEMEKITEGSNQVEEWVRNWVLNIKIVHVK